MKAPSFQALEEEFRAWTWHENAVTVLGFVAATLSGVILFEALSLLDLSLASPLTSLLATLVTFLLSNFATTRRRLQGLVAYATEVARGGRMAFYWGLLLLLLVGDIRVIYAAFFLVCPDDSQFPRSTSCEFLVGNQVPPDWYLMPIAFNIISIVAGVPFRLYCLPIFFSSIILSLASDQRTSGKVRLSPMSVLLLILQSIIIYLGYQVEVTHRSTWIKFRSRLAQKDETLQYAVRNRLQAAARSQTIPKEGLDSKGKDAVASKNLKKISEGVEGFLDTNTILILERAFQFHRGTTADSSRLTLQKYDLTHWFPMIKEMQEVRDYGVKDTAMLLLKMPDASAPENPKAPLKDYIGFCPKNLAELVRRQGGLKEIVQRLSIMMQLSLPHLLRSVGYLLTPSYLMIIVDCPSGASLRSILGSMKDLAIPCTYVRRILTVAANVIARLHKAGIPHGNIGLDNVFLSLSSTDKRIICEVGPISLSSYTPLRSPPSPPTAAAAAAAEGDVNLSALGKDIENLGVLCFCCLLGVLDISPYSVSELRDGALVQGSSEQEVTIMLNILPSSKTGKKPYSAQELTNFLATLVL